MAAIQYINRSGILEFNIGIDYPVVVDDIIADSLNRAKAFSFEGREAGYDIAREKR